MLLDVLPVIDRLNKCFQEENVNLSIIKPRVAAARGRLTELLNEPGDREKEFSSPQNSYKDHNLVHCDAANVRAYTTMRASFLETLIDNMDNSFPQADMAILSALGDIFDVKMYPYQNLQQHATVALETILERFSPDGMDRVLIERNRTRRHFSEFNDTKGP